MPHSAGWVLSGKVHEVGKVGGEQCPGACMTCWSELLVHNKWCIASAGILLPVHFDRGDSYAGAARKISAERRASATKMTDSGCCNGLTELM